MYATKVHHLNRIILEFPEDCGNGIAFWVNQQVGTFLDSLSLRWHDTAYPGTYDYFPNKKASDSAKGGFVDEQRCEWVPLPCGHSEYKNTGKIYKKYYMFGDCFALTELDKYQAPWWHQQEIQTIINGYMDNLCNLLSVSGIHIKASMQFQTYTVIPQKTVKDCSYRDNSKHKAVTINIKEKYRSYNYYEIGSVSREINAPVPVVIAA